MAKKRGCCEERRPQGGDNEETDTELSKGLWPASPVHQSLVFANALRDPRKRGALRVIDPRGCIVSDDNTKVTRKPQRTHCFVVGEAPLKLHPGLGWYFEIEIEGVCEGKMGGMGMGVTTASSSKLANVDWRARAVPESWVVGYWGQVSSCGQQQRIGWKPEELVVGDRVGLLISIIGDCLVFVNERERVLIENLIPTKKVQTFWPLVDIFCCTSSVRYIEDGIPPKRRIPRPEERLSYKPSRAPVQSAPDQSHAPGQSQGASQRAGAEVPAEVSRQDLKDKLAKKLAGKASVRGKKQPVRGKQKDPVEILKERAAAEKGSAPPETTNEPSAASESQPEESLVQPVKGLTMYQTCVLARLAAEKRLRFSAAAGAEKDLSTSSAKQDSKVEIAVTVEKLGEPKSVQSGSKATKAKPRRKTDPSNASSKQRNDSSAKTEKASNGNLRQKAAAHDDVASKQLEDHQDAQMKKPEDPIQNCTDHPVEDVECADEIFSVRQDKESDIKHVTEAFPGSSSTNIDGIESAAYADKVTCKKHECNQYAEYEETEENGNIEAIAVTDDDVKITYAKHGGPPSDTFEEKEEEASSSSQPEEEPQIASVEEPLVKDSTVCERAEVEPAPEASPVSCLPCSFTRAAEPLWVVPGVPRRCGMAGYLGVTCMGQTLFADDDRVDVLCTEGCVAVFHASCYKSFRRPPDRSCLDKTCTGKLCRIWKTGSMGDVTVVFDLKQEQESSVQVPSKSSGSTAVDKAAEKASKNADLPDKAAKPADAQDKAARTTDSQDKVSSGSSQQAQRATSGQSSSSSSQRPGKGNLVNSGRGGCVSAEQGVASTKKKQDAIPAAQAVGKECLRSTSGKASADSPDEIPQVETCPQPRARSEHSSSRRGIPNANELQAAARRCKTGDFMVLAPWRSAKRWGDEESLAVEKGGVVYVSRVDEQGWALGTCRRTQNKGWLPSDFLCRCIYTANGSFSNSIGGYSVIAKGAEEWKEIGWYPADIIVS